MTDTGEMKKTYDWILYIEGLYVFDIILVTKCIFINQ